MSPICRSTLRQNGEVKQQARTSQMIYSVAEIVSFASQSLTLLPGDVILTGTPSGVGPIKAGDELDGANRRLAGIAKSRRRCAAR